MPWKSKVAATIAAGAVAAGTLMTGGAASAATPPKPAVLTGPKLVAGTPYPQNPTNPLAKDRLWIGDNGWNESTRKDGVARDWWETPNGSEKTYLRRIASQPMMRWFQPSNESKTKTISQYISMSQDGDPNTRVHLTLFGIFDIGGGEGSKDSLTPAERNAYTAWIHRVSDEIGTSKVAIMMEPDAPMLYTQKYSPDRMTRIALVRDALQYLSSHNRNAVIYIDGGSADWIGNTTTAATYLKKIGVGYVRGFALGGTHSMPTSNEIVYGSRVVAALNAQGVKGKHFVIDTSDTGHGYDHGAALRKFPNKDVLSCRSATEKVCNALGANPTWQVAGANLTGLPVWVRNLARSNTDAYLWFGKPWKAKQASPYQHGRAVNLAKFQVANGGAVTNVPAPTPSSASASAAGRQNVAMKVTGPRAVKHGKNTAFVVKVTGASTRKAATGKVRFKIGPKVISTKALRGGKAKFQRPMKKGSHRVAFSFLGNAKFKAATRTFTVRAR